LTRPARHQPGSDRPAHERERLAGPGPGTGCWRRPGPPSRRRQRPALCRTPGRPASAQPRWPRRATRPANG